MKKIISLILTIILALSLIACSAGEKKEEAPKATDGAVVVKIDVKDFGTMTLELYPDVAPITVENFLSYVDEGFYDGLTFHRIYKGFMIQGGDPAGDGTGDGGKAPIKGEFSANGVKNDLKHEYGVISMARTKVMDSATSQFFICNATNQYTESLDGQYAAFGKLIDGADVLDAISNVEVTMNSWGEQSQPVNKVVIERIYRAE